MENEKSFLQTVLILTYNTTSRNNKSLCKHNIISAKSLYNNYFEVGNEELLTKRKLKGNAKLTSHVLEKICAKEKIPPVKIENVKIQCYKNEKYKEYVLFLSRDERTQNVKNTVFLHLSRKCKNTKVGHGLFRKLYHPPKNHKKIIGVERTFEKTVENELYSSFETHKGNMSANAVFKTNNINEPKSFHMHDIDTQDDIKKFMKEIKHRNKTPRKKLEGFNANNIRAIIVLNQYSKRMYLELSDDVRKKLRRKNWPVFECSGKKYVNIKLVNRKLKTLKWYTVSKKISKNVQVDSKLNCPNTKQDIIYDIYSLLRKYRDNKISQQKSIESIPSHTTKSKSDYKMLLELKSENHECDSVYQSYFSNHNSVKNLMSKVSDSLKTISSSLFAKQKSALVLNDHDTYSPKFPVIRNDNFVYVMSRIENNFQSNAARRGNNNLNSLQVKSSNMSNKSIINKPKTPINVNQKFVNVRTIQNYNNNNYNQRRNAAPANNQNQKQNAARANNQNQNTALANKQREEEFGLERFSTKYAKTIFDWDDQDFFDKDSISELPVRTASDTQVQSSKPAKPPVKPPENKSHGQNILDKDVLLKELKENFTNLRTIMEMEKSEAKSIKSKENTVKSNTSFSRLDSKEQLNIIFDLMHSLEKLGDLIVDNKPESKEVSVVHKENQVNIPPELLNNTMQTEKDHSISKEEIIQRLTNLEENIKDTMNDKSKEKTEIIVPLTKISDHVLQTEKEFLLHEEENLQESPTKIIIEDKIKHQEESNFIIEHQLNILPLTESSISVKHSEEDHFDSDEEYLQELDNLVIEENIIENRRDEYNANNYELYNITEREETTENETISQINENTENISELSFEVPDEEVLIEDEIIISESSAKSNEISQLNSTRITNSSKPVTRFTLEFNEDILQKILNTGSIDSLRKIINEIKLVDNDAEKLSSKHCQCVKTDTTNISTITNDIKEENETYKPPNTSQNLISNEEQDDANYDRTDQTETNIESNLISEFEEQDVKESSKANNVENNDKYTKFMYSEPSSSPSDVTSVSSSVFSNMSISEHLENNISTIKVSIEDINNVEYTLELKSSINKSKTLVNQENTKSKKVQYILETIENDNNSNLSQEVSKLRTPKNIQIVSVDKDEKENSKTVLQVRSTNQVTDKKLQFILEPKKDMKNSDTSIEVSKNIQSILKQNLRRMQQKHRFLVSLLDEDFKKMNKLSLKQYKPKNYNCLPSELKKQILDAEDQPKKCLQLNKDMRIYLCKMKEREEARKKRREQLKAEQNESKIATIAPEDNLHYKKNEETTLPEDVYRTEETEKPEVNNESESQNRKILENIPRKKQYSYPFLCHASTEINFNAEDTIPAEINSTDEDNFPSLQENISDLQNLLKGMKENKQHFLSDNTQELLKNINKMLDSSLTKISETSVHKEIENITPINLKGNISSEDDAESLTRLKNILATQNPPQIIENYKYCPIRYHKSMNSDFSDCSTHISDSTQKTGDNSQANISTVSTEYSNIETLKTDSSEDTDNTLEPLKSDNMNTVKEEPTTNTENKIVSTKSVKIVYKGSKKQNIAISGRKVKSENEKMSDSSATDSPDSKEETFNKIRNLEKNVKGKEINSELQANSSSFTTKAKIEENLKKLDEMFKQICNKRPLSIEPKVGNTKSLENLAEKDDINPPEIVKMKILEKLKDFSGTLQEIKEEKKKKLLTPDVNQSIKVLDIISEEKLDETKTEIPADKTGINKLPTSKESILSKESRLLILKRLNNTLQHVTKQLSRNSIVVEKVKILKQNMKQIMTSNGKTTEIRMAYYRQFSDHTLNIPFSNSVAITKQEIASKLNNSLLLLKDLNDVVKYAKIDPEAAMNKLSAMEVALDKQRNVPFALGLPNKLPPVKNYIRENITNVAPNSKLSPKNRSTPNIVKVGEKPIKNMTPKICRSSSVKQRSVSMTHPESKAKGLEQRKSSKILPKIITTNELSFKNQRSTKNKTKQNQLSPCKINQSVNKADSSSNIMPHLIVDNFVPLQSEYPRKDNLDYKDIEKTYLYKIVNNIFSDRYIKPLVKCSTKSCITNNKNRSKNTGSKRKKEKQVAKVEQESYEKYAWKTLDWKDEVDNTYDLGTSTSQKKFNSKLWMDGNYNSNIKYNRDVMDRPSLVTWTNTSSTILNRDRNTNMTVYSINQQKPKWIDMGPNINTYFDMVKSSDDTKKPGWQDMNPKIPTINMKSDHLTTPWQHTYGSNKFLPDLNMKEKYEAWRRLCDNSPVGSKCDSNRSRPQSSNIYSSKPSLNVKVSRKFKTCTKIVSSDTSNSLQYGVLEKKNKSEPNKSRFGADSKKAKVKKSKNLFKKKSKNRPSRK